jgi:hypothetical protein
MKCPLDGTTLTIAERQGIEIDYCPQCRGVWLDRGELDKLIDRSAQEYGPQQGQPAAAPRYAEEPRYERPPHYRPYGDHDDDDDHRRGGHRKRRRGFLDDVFDFD